MTMKTLITLENFEANKFKIKNAVSVFNKMLNPNKWAESLSIFDFDENGEEITTSYLISEFKKELKNFN
jgi:hypothetical protein